MKHKLLATVGLSSLMVLFTACGDSSSGSTSTELGAQTTLANGNVEYVDYKGEKRVAEESAGNAEYHTGTGFGHTLFDSAEKKCQNCHNEMYDTWESSMHGQSWKDKIFQSKMQDFLRVHMAKIGEDKSSSGTEGREGKEYTEAMFTKGSSQTCIKCHAPGAYYAGDFKVELETLKESDVTTEDFNNAKIQEEENTAVSPLFDPTKATSVISLGANGKLYKATFEIGHEANTEGINCAFCHSIETVGLMKEDGVDMGEYTLAGDLRFGPHGPKKRLAGDTLKYSVDATEKDMNEFFRLWGPEKYSDFAHTPKEAADFDQNKSKDGRYTMASKDINGTDGKVHYTGGPFYGPYGTTGTTNENETDETNRSAHLNPNYHAEDNNHFNNHGKALCLSCHQRSSGAKVPGYADGAGHYMELCSTWNAVSNGSGTNHGDTHESPKCQKCHMERIQGTVLHEWARPDKLYTKESNPHLTAHFDPNDTTTTDNPVRDKWLNSHAFLGASKTGHKTSAVAKIKSGFKSTLDASKTADTLTVTTTLQNKTAHMFPGAHPMRRVLTRVIVTDASGAKVAVASSTGNSTFADIVNSVQPLQGKTLHSSAIDGGEVTVEYNENRVIDFPAKTADLNGTAIDSQKFSGAKVVVQAPDGTVKNQSILNGKVVGTVTNAAIVDSNDSSNFTRIYGHETGKKLDENGSLSASGTFVVRPGFDSNMVESDNRLTPNETETYTLNYDVSGKTGLSVTYKVYYMQKGANGKFLTAEDGFLNQTASDAKSFLVSEVFSETKSVE